jgi:hypothetical protein
MPPAPYRRAPRAPEAPVAPRTAAHGSWDIHVTWLVLVAAGIVRLCIAFARGEPPFGAFPISEPGLAFLLVVIGTPRAARLLPAAVAAARDEAARQTPR